MGALLTTILGPFGPIISSLSQLSGFIIFLMILIPMGLLALITWGITGTAFGTAVRTDFNSGLGPTGSTIINVILFIILIATWVLCSVSIIFLSLVGSVIQSVDRAATGAKRNTNSTQTIRPSGGRRKRF